MGTWLMEGRTVWVWILGIQLNASPTPSSTLSAPWISPVSCTNDTVRGKVLRVRQQYFFCSASLQKSSPNYVRHHGTNLTGFAGVQRRQLNDTHPVSAIPSSCASSWTSTASAGKSLGGRLQDLHATNHGSGRALETWDITSSTVCSRASPRSSANRPSLPVSIWPSVASTRSTINYMAPVASNTVRMAWDRLLRVLLHQRRRRSTRRSSSATPSRSNCAIWLKRFNNKTNGVTRRWL